MSSKEPSLLNLRKLSYDMKKKEKAVVVVDFTYKQTNYFVAVCLLTENERNKAETKFALVRLCFMHADDLDNSFECYATSYSILSSITEIRHFFGVKYQANGFDWINKFLANLNNHIPIEVPMENNYDNICAHVICKAEYRDPNRIYRSHLIRNGVINGKQKHRTVYNSQLAELRYPKLYPKLKDDKTISFAFTDNPAKEKTEEQILLEFTQRDNKQ